MQIGLHDSISPETIEGAEIIYGNLLDEGEKVRHHPGKLAQVVLLCQFSLTKMQERLRELMQKI